MEKGRKALDNLIACVRSVPLIKQEKPCEVLDFVLRSFLEILMSMLMLLLKNIETICSCQN